MSTARLHKLEDTVIMDPDSLKLPKEHGQDYNMVESAEDSSDEVET